MINFDINESGLATPKIAVVGVGGAGGNTINWLLASNLENVEYVAINTDAQALGVSHAPCKLQIGMKSAKGLGSGANPELGKRAAEEDLSEILELLKKSDIVFLTGGLGGGTGSGALPVIAQALKERDILSIAVVTKPFSFEGNRRMKVAETAENLIKKSVDTLVTIPNEKLLSLTKENPSLVGAFEMVNTTIYQFVKSIADIITQPGHINVDFADVKTIMKGMGVAVMGTGTAQGENRAQRAAKAAIESPLLDTMSIKGAQSILINVSGSSELGLFEVSQAVSCVSQEAHKDANIILGSVIDESMGDAMSVTVVATNFTVEAIIPAAVEMPSMIKVQAPVEQSCPIPVVCAEKMDTKDETSTFMARHPLKDILLTEKTDKKEVAPEPDLEVPTLLRKMVLEKRSQQKN